MVALKKEAASEPPSGLALTEAGTAEPAAAGAAETPGTAAPLEKSAKSAPSDFKPAGIQVRALNVSKGLEPARVRNAIASVLVAREWEVTEQTDEHVVGHIKHRRSEAFLTLVIDVGQIRFYCEGWKIDKNTGARIKPELPESWIDNIKNDLAVRLTQTLVGQ